MAKKAFMAMNVAFMAMRGIMAMKATPCLC
jgi:hypothetical protein